MAPFRPHTHSLAAKDGNGVGHGDGDVAMAMACRAQHNGQKEDASQVPRFAAKRSGAKWDGWRFECRGVANVITAQCNLVSEHGEQEQETRCMPREHKQHGSRSR